jgi:hypothetical protein
MKLLLKAGTDSEPSKSDGAWIEAVVENGAGYFCTFVDEFHPESRDPDYPCLRKFRCTSAMIRSAIEPLVGLGISFSFQ